MAVFLLTFSVSAQIEKFPLLRPNRMINWKQINNDSSVNLGIGIADYNTGFPLYPATFFNDSTGYLSFDSYCFNRTKGFSDDYAIRKAPYKINRQDSLVLWYGSTVNWRNWTTGQMFYKTDTIEIVYTYLDSALLATDSTYPNASHMQHLGYLITTQDSIVMKRYAQSLSHLFNGNQLDTTIYLGFRKHMFSLECAAWVDNVYMSYSGVNSTKSIQAANFELYPNPGRDQLTIRCDEKITSIRIRDLSGRILANPTILDSSIDCSALSTGVYLVEVRTLSGKTSVQKWVKH